MNFYLPDFNNKDLLNFNIIDLLKEHPEYFYDNINIGAVYGSFPGAIWNGGRQFLYTTSADRIESTIEAFNSRNIPLRFTFTNCLLEEKHLNDTYCNFIMDAANNGMNGIIVNSEILENYLREKYPNYQYILSTTKCERNINNINMACKKYDMVVTDYRDNSNMNFLEQIQQKDKIELLINAYCDPNCTHREEHYRELSQGQLDFHFQAEVRYCDTYIKSFYDILKYDSVIKLNDLYTTYLDMGFNNFKIEGRSNTILDVLESYMYYLIKPEHRDEVRLFLLKHC